MINLVKLSAEDVDKILKLESDFKDAWNKSMLESAFNQERFHCFGLVEDDKLVSVCYINLAGKDADIESIYTLKEHRKKGYAKILLDSVIDFIKSKGVDRIFLEVRTSNTIAKSLYKKLGFESISIRKKYYEDEDGEVMLNNL